MNFKKIALAALAGTMVMSVSAMADDQSAFLMFTDSAWAWGNWNPAEAGVDAVVTGSGTYTVSVTKDSLTTAGKEVTGDATGATVFCVDMNGYADTLGISKDDATDDNAAWDSSADKMAYAKSKGVTVKDVKIIVDGADYKTLADGEFLYGDIEDKGNLRIEIKNQYGTLTTGYDDLKVTDSIAVQFTLDIAEVEAPSEPAGDVAPIAYLAALVAVAGIALVASKKRA